MYIPKHYEIRDNEEIESFIKEHPFATVISHDQSMPVATHLPLILHQEEDRYYLTGHFAKANPQWQTMNDNDNILVIFQGSHAYISSTWYEDEDVPTWNYQSVHVYGKSRLLTEDELLADLTDLLDYYEGPRENGAVWENMSDKTRKQISGIIGFKVEINNVQAAYKLSQNRSKNDHDNIIHQLRQSENTVDHLLAEAMRNHRQKRD